MADRDPSEECCIETTSPSPKSTVSATTVATDKRTSINQISPEQAIASSQSLHFTLDTAQTHQLGMAFPSHSQPPSPAHGPPEIIEVPLQDDPVTAGHSCVDAPETGNPAVPTPSAISEALVARPASADAQNVDWPEAQHASPGPTSPYRQRIHLPSGEQWHTDNDDLLDDISWANVVPRAYDEQVGVDLLSPDEMDTAVSQHRPIVNIQNDSESDSEAEITVLDPDHPLMKRFQEALGRHLQAKLDQLTLDERELNSKVLAKKKERESLGVLLYSQQQDLAQSQMRLEQLGQDLQCQTAQRLLREAEMNSIRKLYRKVAANADESRKKTAELLKELENINLRTFYLMASLNDVQSDVKVMKRAAKKTREDLLKDEELKQRQDYMVNTLVELADVRKQEIEMYKLQCQAQHEQSVRYKELLSEADIELSVLHSDLKRVEQNWKSTLIGMARRDEMHAAMMETIQAEEQVLLCKEKEVGAYKHNIKQAEEKHERLTYLLNKANSDIATSKKQLLKNQKKLEEHQIEYAQRQRVLQQSESSLANALADKKAKLDEQLALRKSYEEAVRERNNFKSCLIERLQTQAAYIKAAQYTRCKADLTSTLTQQMESDMADEENMFAATEQELLAHAARMALLKETLASVSNEIARKNQLANNYENTLQKNHVLIERKQNHMDLINKRLAVMMEQMEGEEMSPLENLLRNLSKQVRKENVTMLNDQTVWVEQQQELLEISKQRHQVADDIKHRHQEILVLTGKKRTLSAQIEEEVIEEKKWDVDMRHIRVEMENIALLVMEKKGMQEQMQSESYREETEFIRELKDKELEVMRQQARFKAINQEKEFLLNRIIELEFQTSLWTRKIQIGVEMKETVDPKNERNSEIQMMKSEIHRMRVRFSSLMREQENLIRQMEDAVTRREYIVKGSKAAIKKEPELLTHSKCRQAIIANKERIEKTKQSINEMDEKKTELQESRTLKGEELDAKKKHTSLLQTEVENLEKVVKDLSNEKHRNLSELVARQQRSSLLTDVKSGKYKRICRNPSQLDSSIAQELELATKIQTIAASLQERYPEARDMLSRSLSVYGLRGVSGPS